MKMFLIILLIVSCFFVPPLAIAVVIFLIIKLGIIGLKLSGLVLLISVIGYFGVPIFYLFAIITFTVMIMIGIGLRANKNNPLKM